MELVAKFFDITKLPSKIFAWVALLAGVYVLSPSSFLKTLYLDAFPPEYKSYAGAAFVASTSFLAINALLWSWNNLLGTFRKRTRKKLIRRALADLDRDEIAALREFVIQARHVIELPVDHPTVAGLRNKQVIQLAGTTGYRDLAGSVFPVQMTEYARTLITPEMLNLPEHPTAEDVERVHNERPNYISQIERADRLRGGFHW